jgi:RNA methyltransferase, TrmH family
VSDAFREARRDPELGLLEGFHAVKHALRFGATLVDAVAPDVEALEALAATLAPDLAGEFRRRVRRAPSPAGRTAAPDVVAIARRPAVALAAVLADPRPLVLLEEPRRLGNLGACVRVAAACDVAGVLTTGPSDPWHPDALRGAAGLHFALPVTRIAELPATDRPLVAIDPTGDELAPAELPPRALLAFGTERYGLSDALLARADARLRIPMRAGVSSLNLATSVAAVLYAWRLTPRDGR